MRVFTPHVDEMEHPHVAYISRRDSFGPEPALTRKLAKAHDAPLAIRKVKGDHVSSLDVALQKFMARVEARHAPAPE